MATTTTTSTETQTSAPRPGLRVRVQQFGTFLSNMIMPNIGAIIAWGLITAFFIPDGWVPNEKIATMVGPSIFYLLPILIAYTGGKLVYDVRGGVVGGFAVIGVIMATSDPIFIGDDGGAPMFLGAMIMGPLTALVMKKLDALWSHKIRPGFEMLVNNFSAGILAALMAIGGMFLLAPVLRTVTDWLGDAVNTLVDNNLLPLTSIFIEPAKVLFLNNAINHGVLTPLGIQEAAREGQSVLFLLEANPGPGLGLLLAYSVFGRGLAKASAPGAAIIQFFGGIHEVYFPYVLMKPKMILATIAGGMTGIFLLVLFDVGLRAPAAPGSIFAVYAQTPSGDFFGITVGVFGAALVSFLVGSLLLRMDRSEDGDLMHATAAMEDMKGKKSVASSTIAGGGTATLTGPIRDIVFACDAGMGSSAMGASVLRRKIQEAGFDDVTVVNKSIASLTDDYDVVVSHQDLTDRARQKTSRAVHVSVENFMGSPRYDEIVEMVEASNGAGAGSGVAAEEESSSGELLAEQSVVLRGFASTRNEAITEAGELLLDVGAVDRSYLQAMHDREESVSTHMGNGLAIPHGTNEAKSAIHRTAISFVRYPDGIDWNGHQVKFVIGIAGAGKDHLPLLGQIAQVFTDQDKVAQLEAARTVEEVRRILA
ncbi:PTS mannitol transporter subunit IICBA [Nocardioides guangzhouensis]|uniref:Mannitol-specific phosphotransferase enzyme IIA component n=1 Tax=Nocardioides guangzhouensis TaxID=2497878 RepID=A0A4Q4Z5W4_9ACTN|nr:PTS mannitol transporter subunit IICBA [Nocardioides guangzhouensis]RYP83180.1 PTS mannitol transporter subunit IICBA [Nocardioides guangzhouensis]